MKKLLFILFAALFCSAAAGQDGKTSIRREALDTKLTGISASAGFKVNLLQGEQSRVVIEIDSQLEPYLVYRIRNGRLELGLNNPPNRLMRGNKWPHAEVTVSALDYISASSAASITGESSFTSTGYCEIRVNSAGSIQNLKLSADKIDIDGSSAGAIKGLEIKAQLTDIDFGSAAHISASGTTDQLKAEVSSAGSIVVKDLKAREVSARASSAGSIQCWVNEKLNAHSSSGGSIRYRVDPPDHRINLSTSSSSGGSVSSMR